MNMYVYILLVLTANRYIVPFFNPCIIAAPYKGL